MRLQIGHTPDADDAFMFWGMIEGGVDHRGLQLVHRIEPLPVLNEWALDAQLEVTAMSFNTYRSRHIQYRPLAPGVSWGHGYGPKIIFQTTEPDQQRDVLAVPGRGSTAALLAQRFGWTGPFLELAYTELMQAVELGRAQAALIIHEEQLLFESKGWKQLVDLGRWWADNNSGLPVPLGVNCVRRDVPQEVAQTYCDIFESSIRSGLANREAALEFSMQYARQADRRVARDFVGMYVNDSTLTVGPKEFESIRLLLDSPEVPLDFVSVTSLAK